MRVVEFMVRGTPAPAGSKTPMPVYAGSGEDRHWTGRTNMVEGRGTPESTRRRTTWRAAVADAVKDMMAERTDLLYPMDFPLALGIIFTLRRPDSHYGSGRNSHLVLPSAPHAPATKPDLGKYIRAVEDEITSAGFWRDDARVVTYDKMAKCFVNTGLGAPFPGALVRIRADVPPAPAAQQATLLSSGDYHGPGLPL